MPLDANTTPTESLNAQLARALGIEPTNLTRLVLTLAPQRAPLIEATYRLRTAEGITEAVRRLELVCEPASEPASAPPAP